jgi:hypothetical protein
VGNSSPIFLSGSTVEVNKNNPIVEIREMNKDAILFLAIEHMSMTKTRMNRLDIAWRQNEGRRI